VTGRRAVASDCTCTAWVGEDDAVHVAACCDEHEAAVERAAKELGEQMTLEVVVDPGPW
jgi:hypothetical protein